MTTEKTQEEEPFVKIYYRRLMSRLKCEDAQLGLADFIVLLGLVEKGRLGSSTIEIVQRDLVESMEMSAQQVNRSVKRLEKLGIILKEGNRHYILNPNYLWKGKANQMEGAKNRLKREGKL